MKVTVSDLIDWLEAVEQDLGSETQIILFTPGFKLTGDGPYPLSPASRDSVFLYHIGAITEEGVVSIFGDDTGEMLSSEKDPKPELRLIKTEDAHDSV